MPRFSHPKPEGPIIKHIPKSARPACCSTLTAILNNIVHNNRDLPAWNKLLNFASDVLLNPPRDGGRSGVAQCIKNRIAGRMNANHMCTSRTTSHKRGSFDLSRAVTAKIEDGNIKAAIRLLCSEDKPADCSEAVVAALRSTHPAAPSSRTAVPDPATINSLQVTEADVLRAVKAFPAGSSGGPDGLRPQHLLVGACLLPNQWF